MKRALRLLVPALMTCMVILLVAPGVATALSGDQVFEFNGELGATQGYELNDDLADTSWEFSFVQLTDLHIGEGPDDYGTPGYDDKPPAGDVGEPAVELRDAVNWINANKATYMIKFVIITGDLTQSAERSEFLKGKEILDSLDIPYIPVIGNHDIWPYTQTEESPSPVGDQYFREVFADQFETLRNLMPGWDDGTRNTLIVNGEEGCNSYFQNFAFDYAGYHFICADFNTRSHAISGKGANPWANLFDSEACRGTWYWYKNHFNSYPYKAANNVLTFTHQPLYNNSVFTFSEGEYNTITDFFYNNNYKDNVGLWMGGHFHEAVPPWSPPFEYEIKTSTGHFICPGVHSKASKDGYSRLVKTWGKTSTPNPSGVILY
ncbi:MAG: metallophosphoesterase, partial [Actinomycetia bacterium]|nr:metallophosphoesterase [Actinomycetes bacterium]